ncbi:MAG: peptide-methionine (S)-S-oxide reductase MsrA [Methylocapsa sp.]|nr:peptide-methionine (S)-S-oxide reductase MsrA [Methylocapsa sp.]
MRKSSSQSPPRPSGSGRTTWRSGLIPAVLGGIACAAGADAAVFIDPPQIDLPAPAQGETGKAVFAGGCFWGVQAVFQHTKGVLRAISGYAGGTLQNPTYEKVSSGRTGHAESVEVTFDPKEISFGRLLQVYFSVAHDPTQLDRQGPDEGSQYRSAIFALSKEQQNIAEAYIAQLNNAGVFPRPIVTKVEPLQIFYPAETYHQDYATEHPGSAYVAVNDLPKIENLQKLYPELYRQRPVLVGSPGE